MRNFDGVVLWACLAVFRIVSFNPFLLFYFLPGVGWIKESQPMKVLSLVMQNILTHFMQFCILTAPTVQQ
jgi:hypothetical protein